MKTQLYPKLLLCFVFSFILHTSSFSQEEISLNKTNAFYFSTMFEVSNYSLGISIKPTVRIKKHLISIRQLITWKEHIPKKDTQGIFFKRRDRIVPETEFYSELSLLYGRMFELENGFISISAGAAYIDGVEKGNFLYSEPHTGLFGEDLGTETKYYESIDKSGFGIPIVAEGIFKNSSGVIRFGFSGSITINPNYVFYSLGIGIQLRKKTRK